MKTFLLCVFSVAGFALQAQDARVKGRVLDEATRTPIDFATVLFKSTNDTILPIGAKTDQDGNFDIAEIPYGTYQLNISSIGYNTLTQKNVQVKGPLQLGDLTLGMNTKTLKNVVISGEREGITLGIDRITFNVEKNITAAGGTAGDVLRNVPSVNVDVDGNLSLRGKSNVTLLVDGKPSAMFGNDAATALQSIPASSIESIEVINNPSARYEAQGMNGIINIILKKDRKPGYNLLVNAGIAEPFRLNGGINLNANIHKWNFFINANARTARTWEITRSHRENFDSGQTFSSNTYNSRRPLSGFANMGVEYTFNAHNKITLSQNLFNANMKGNSNNVIEYHQGNDELLSAQNRHNTYTGQPLSATTNLQYKHTFTDPKEELNVELNYSTSRYIRSSNFETSLYDSSLNLVNYYLQKNPIDGGNTNATVQIDYSKPLGKVSRIDLGERSYFIRFRSQNQPTIQYLNQPEIEETLLKNNFVFNQQVHGAYATFATQYRGFGVQAGLRAEYFTYEGTAFQYNSSVSDRYINVFPSVFLSRKLSRKDDLNMNYARRVNRPNFFQLIPYLDVSNPLDTSQGNPSLKPEFIHAFELTYTHQDPKTGTWIASAYYQYTNNLIQRYRRFNADGTTYSQNRNLATGVTYGVEFTGKVNIQSWWDATANINLFRNHINGTNVDATITRSGYGGFGKLSTNAKFLYGFSSQLSANYFITTVVSQGEVQPYGNVDVAIKKTLFKNLLTLTLNCNDIFNTQQTETVYSQYPFYSQTVLRKNQTRSIGLNAQLRLASRSQQKNAEAPKRAGGKKEKEKETRNRDENLKKDDGGNDESGGGTNSNR